VVATRVWSIPLRAARRALAHPRIAEGADRASEPRFDQPPRSSAEIDIAPDDPLIGLLEEASDAIDIDAVEIDSPAVCELRAAGVRLCVPLMSQGELIGVLNLGPRLSAQGTRATRGAYFRASPPRPRRHFASASSCGTRRQRLARASGSSTSSRWLS
jgi:hypothetical protein